MPCCFILREVYQLFDLLDAIWRLILQGSFSKSLSRLNGSICFNTLILRGVDFIAFGMNGRFVGQGWLIGYLDLLVWGLLISWASCWQVLSSYLDGFF